MPQGHLVVPPTDLKVDSTLMIKNAFWNHKRVLEQETPADDPSPKLAEVVVSVAVRGASRRNSRRQLRIA